MKILIIGGHLSPALCVMENLKNEEIFYVGRKHAMEGDSAFSLEYKVVSKLQIPFYDITAARFQRKFTRHSLPSLFKFPKGFIQALLILRKIKPDVVVGFGGYVSIPIVISAYFLKIPVVIHEQTLEIGFANKILSPFATKICISWESSKKFFPQGKTILTGLPIKKEIINAKTSIRSASTVSTRGEQAQDKKDKHDLPFLYITGGSLGSHKINLLVEKILPQLLQNFIVFHQTGDSKMFNDFDRLKNLKDNLNVLLRPRYTVKKFLHSEEITDVLAKSDMVVSRAGINTVAELAFLQKPAFLIPIHFSQRNEQLKNAYILKDTGLGEIGDETVLTFRELLSSLLQMQKNLNQYKVRKAQVLLDEKASDKIINVIKDVARQKKT